MTTGSGALKLALKVSSSLHPLLSTLSSHFFPNIKPEKKTKMHHHNLPIYHQPPRPPPRRFENPGQVSFFPIAPYVFSTTTHAKRWTREVASCSIGDFDVSRSSQTICYALLKALSEDSRFTIHRAAQKHFIAVDWHVPGYWALTSQSEPWVKLLEFGCFVMDIAVPNDECTV